MARVVVVFHVVRYMNPDMTYAPWESRHLIVDSSTVTDEWLEQERASLQAQDPARINRALVHGVFPLGD